MPVPPLPPSPAWPLAALASAASVGLEWLAWGAGLAVVTFGLTLTGAAIVLIRIPPDYFSGDAARSFLTHQPAWIRITARFAKNVLGGLLVIAGTILTIPGVPGPGMITILIGVMLLDFPRKRALERRIVSIRPVLRTINALRARFGRPPLLIQPRPRRRDRAAARPPDEGGASHRGDT